MREQPQDSAVYSPPGYSPFDAPQVVAPPVTTAAVEGQWFLTGGPDLPPYPLVEPLTRVGRADPYTGSHPDLNVGSDDTVSRRHAELRRTAAGIEIVDCGSTNGTRVNGQALVPHEPHSLASGDIITVGAGVVLTLFYGRISDAQAARSKPASPGAHLEESVSIEEQDPHIPGVVSFPTTLRGYDRDAVDHYCHNLRERAESAEAQAARLREELQAASRDASAPAQAPDESLRAELESARVRIHEFEEAQAAVHRALIVAQRAADEVRAGAETEAAQIVTDAREQARSIAAEGEAHRAEAKREAETILADARARVDEEAKAAAAELAKRLDEMRADQMRAEAALKALADRQSESEAEWRQRVEALAGFADQLRASLAGAPSR